MKGSLIMGKTNFDPDRSLLALSNRAARALTRALNRRFHRAGFETTAEQWSALASLAREDGQRQRDLAESSGRDRVGVTKIVDALEQRGMVERRQDERDRRSNRVFLTSSGKTAQRTLAKIAKQMLTDIEKDVAPRSIDKLAKSFEDLIAALETKETGE